MPARGSSGLQPVAIAPALALMLAAIHPAPAAAQSTSLEASVKAAFLAKFAPFVEWPPPALASPTDTLHLCIAGDQDLAALVRQVAQGAGLGRPIAVRRLELVERGSQCHILFVTDSRRQSVRAALGVVRGTPTLTVTDGGGSGQTGVINFVRAGSTVRFAIDEQAAAENQLEIRSKLLQLAVSVRRRS